MTAESGSLNEPGPDEIRAALRRVLDSPVLSASPQLSAFLSFVVEAALNGKSRQIKGYTIAVEALGRAGDFDPQTDSIVRVVAGRLRRALLQYYVEAGAAETIVIDLPRGGYIPIFSRAAVPALSSRIATPLNEAISGWGRGRFAPPGGIATMASGLATVMARTLRLGEAPGTNAEKPAPIMRCGAPSVPVVIVEPFMAIGQPAAPGLAIDQLQARFSDALARFDAITVIEAEPSSNGRDRAAAGESRFGGAVEYNKDGTITLSFRLVDADGIVLWSRSFEGLRGENEREVASPAIIREVVTTVASPLGVVWAREIASTTAKDANRECQLLTIEYWRRFDPALLEPVRRCLGRMITDDPSWAPGHFGLALVCLREFLTDIVRSGEPPALDRGLEYARRAVELRPQSARAHHALFSVLFARGEIAMAFAAAERATVLNPYDTDVIADYGGRLIASGQVEKGMALLDEAFAGSLSRPIWAEIYLAIGAYLAGDVATATRNVAMIGDNVSPQGLLARALIANVNGERDKARQAIDRLTSLNPAWRTSPRRQLGKFFPSAEMRDRVLRDLQAAGLEEVG